MSLFAIADLHLSLGKDKSMKIFKGWERHAERLTQNWNDVVGEDDTVVIAGDISWAISLEDALPDLNFISKVLKGRKIIIKGNHDYWWTSVTKMNNFISENHMNNIEFLHNSAFIVEKAAVCGTRGWFNEGEPLQCEKMRKREESRLETSIRQAFEMGHSSEVCVFLHYPPIYGDFTNYNIVDILQKNDVKRCFYGHLHGDSHKKAVLGKHYGIEFALISADFIDFKPLKI
ncbi:MAG: metallophosphoesterase [Oscillospiraceae bacterium]|nr:metallophosphoesterase [Oscillospiraceae bacterium]